MTKLYYDDALKSAWMAREFGVQIDGLGSAYGCTSHKRILKTDKDKYYIHPDSYHIFEPQDGDLDIEGFKLYTFEDGRTYWHFGDDKQKDVSSTFIRNNTAFFTPKEKDND